ncbi:hypothetical protein [Parapedobacter defluvii]|uniref:hypothetical protein n=1 Tax=Parapedobacter defluvii TaxID=2045106 RepID=UPI001664247B|nr:hypothetical protein [Parapedobacter defluvii]
MSAFGRKTKLRRFFPLCPVASHRGAAGQRQGGFRGTRKHNLQGVKHAGFWFLTGRFPLLALQWLRGETPEGRGEAVGMLGFFLVCLVVFLFC